VCEFFILATLDFYLIYYCVHVFCQLPPRTAAALSMEKNKTFMAALAVKNKTNPDPRAYPLIIAVISWNAETYYYSPKKVKENKKNNLKKENIFLALVVFNFFFWPLSSIFFWKLKIFFISLYFNSHICVLEFDFYFLLPYK